MLGESGRDLEHRGEMRAGDIARLGVGEIATRPHVELPAALAWSNTLASVDGVALVARGREGFRSLLESRPDDQELEERVRKYWDETRKGLEGVPGAEQMLRALGDVEDLEPQ